MIAVVIVAMFGCDPPGQKPTVSTATASNTASTTSAAIDPKAARREAKKNSLSFAYVDGEIRGVIRHGEMPAGFEPTMKELSGPPFPIWNLAGYIQALGVDLAKVQGIHLVGSSRTVAITGDELRRPFVRDNLAFQFSKSIKGRPMMWWPRGRVETTTRIDRVTDLVVFVEKKPPTWHRDDLEFRYEDGSVVKGAAYAKGERIKNARVYLDGKLLGAIGGQTGGGNGKGGGGKGKGKGKGVGAGGGERTVAGVLKRFDIPLDAIKAVDFISPDEKTVGRFDAAGWRDHGSKLSFEPRKKGRLMHMTMPPEATPEPGVVHVKAVLVYVEKDAPKNDVQAPKRRPGKGAK